MRFDPGADVYLVGSHYYPHLPPHVVVNWGDGNGGSSFALDWDRMAPEGDRLEAALRQFVDPPGPFRVAWGPSVGIPATDKAEVAAKAGWRRFLTGRPLLAASNTWASERIEPRAVSALGQTHLLLVGVGSVGSYMAETLVRSGLGAITLIDHDHVERPNLSRTMYELGDLGHHKTSALARRLLNINPAICVADHAATFNSLGTETARRLFDDATIILSVTDDPAAQALINGCAFHARKPAVYVGLYKGAKGGEVVFTVPGTTPCLRCCVGNRPSFTDGISDPDYGTARLPGEIALGCDIHHVASAGTKIIVSLLTLLVHGYHASGSSELAFRALVQGTTMVTIGLEPKYWPELYGPIFETTPGQLAFQSVWLKPSIAEECIVCGTAVGDDDPFSYVAPVPDLSQFRFENNQ